MRNEIQKVLDLRARGKITQEQATELILAIKSQEADNAQEPEVKKSTDSESGPQSYTEFSTENLGEFIQKIVQNAITGRFGKMKGKFSDAKFKFGDRDDENRVNASKIETPRGEDYEFSDNTFNLSSFTKFEMHQESSFSDNSLQASTVSEINLSHSKVSDSSWNGSSWDSMQITDSELSDLRFHGCKWTKGIVRKSELSDDQFNGCSLKDSEFSQCVISDSNFNGVQWSHSPWTKVEMSNFRIHGSLFQNATFIDVKISDGQILGCKFVDCELRNLELDDFNWKNIDFSNQKIDGEQALHEFLNKQKSNW